MTDQLTYRVRWIGTPKESDLTDLSVDAHQDLTAHVRASPQGMHKLERYLAKAPGVMEVIEVVPMGDTMFTVQGFIDMRKG